MRYAVEFTRRAAKDLTALPRPAQLRVARRIDRLADSPRPRGCRKLAGPEAFYRIRVGDVRIIYSIEDRRLVVLVIRIGHRREVYR